MITIEKAWAEYEKTIQHREGYIYIAKDGFSKAWDLQQSKIDELVNALEFLNTKANFEGKKYFHIDELLEKHKKYKEGWE
jgi:hypothetical protein